ncbi:MAG: hypothetical protein OEN56_04795 [Gemmatimonadota bacterium]|nr:hypothetical protein [Gemmatimonadota bacterium]MDH3424804.1 hypothetical protein [Gemmatimonadota bacterium]
MGRIVFGIILAVVGGVALWLGEIPYTERETIELGPIQASADVDRALEIPPIAAGLVLALGVGIVAYDVARRGTS